MSHKDTTKNCSKKHKLLKIYFSKPHANCNILKIMASWLDMMDSEGWIPREVVLDSEAHIRAPPLLFEDHAVANPPMFIYLMDKLLNVPQVGLCSYINVD